jgi:hypothetical protein
MSVPSSVGAHHLSRLPDRAHHTGATGAVGECGDAQLDTWRPTRMDALAARSRRSGISARSAPGVELPCMTEARNAVTT